MDLNPLGVFLVRPYRSRERSPTLSRTVGSLPDPFECRSSDPFHRPTFYLGTALTLTTPRPRRGPNAVIKRLNHIEIGCWADLACLRYSVGLLLPTLTFYSTSAPCRCQPPTMPTQKSSTIPQRAGSVGGVTRLTIIGSPLAPLPRALKSSIPSPTGLGNCRPRSLQDGTPPPRRTPCGRTSLLDVEGR